MSRSARKWLVLCGALLTCSLGLHWLDRQITRASTQRDIVWAIQDAGGQVLFDDDPPLAYDPSDSWPFTRAWIRDQFGEEYCREITAVRYGVATNNPFETPPSLKPLRRCPDIVTLELLNPDITNADLKILGSLPRLRKLALSLTSISSSGLRHLQSLKQLTSLDLSATSVDDRCLVHLERLSTLRQVNLSFTNVSPEGLAKIKAALPLARIEHNGLSRRLYADDEPPEHSEPSDEENPFR